MLKKNPLVVDIESLPLTISSLREIKDSQKFPPSVTLQGFSKDVTSKYSCMICKEVLTEPVKTSCQCSVTICNNCFTMNNSKCPICRKFTQATVNEHIRKQLALQEIVCKCGIKYKHGEKEEHDALCVLSFYACPACNIESNGPNMLIHLKQRHYLQLLATSSHIL